MPDDVFFAAVAVAYGPPDLTARQYMSDELYWTGRPEVGLTAYMRDTEQGQLFARMVIEAGEAKARVNKLYWRYCKWVQEQEKLRDYRQNQLGGNRKTTR